MPTRCKKRQTYKQAPDVSVFLAFILNTDQRLYDYFIVTVAIRSLSANKITNVGLLRHCYAHTGRLRYVNYDIASCTESSFSCVEFRQRQRPGIDHHIALPCHRPMLRSYGHKKLGNDRVGLS